MRVAVALGQQARARGPVGYEMGRGCWATAAAHVGQKQGGQAGSVTRARCPVSFSSVFFSFFYFLFLSYSLPWVSHIGIHVLPTCIPLSVVL